MILDTADGSPKVKVAIYTRVSTQEQEVDGYSLEAQNKRLREYVTNNPGLNQETHEEWIFSDTDSGSIIDHPALVKLRELVAQKKVQAVLVWKIDRLSRNLQHLLILFDEFEKASVRLISLQENINFSGPIGKLVFQMFGAIAQFERELIKDRTKVGCIASAEAGNFTGAAIPFGYRAIRNPNGKGKKLEVIVSEKIWVKKIFSMYVDKRLGFGEIATHLNTHNVSLGLGSLRKRKDQSWTTRMVGTLIENRIYTGQFIANKTRPDGGELPSDQWTVVEVPGCIDRLTYTLAQEIRGGKSFGNNKKYLLAGKLRDITGGISKGMSGVKRAKGGYSYRRKPFIQNGTRHSVLEIPMKQIDEYIWNKLVYAFKSPHEFVQEYITGLNSNAESVQELEKYIALLEQEIAKIELALERLQTDYYDHGEISKETFHKMHNDRITKLEAMRGSVIEASNRLMINSQAKVEIETLKDIAKYIPGDIKAYTLPQKKILVDLFVETVQVEQVVLADGSKKRDVHIYYRFNPKKWLSWKPRGYTEEELTDNKKRPTDSQKDENGATCRT